MVVQHIGIGKISQKEYLQTESGQFFECKGHYDIKEEISLSPMTKTPTPAEM